MAVHILVPLDNSAYCASASEIALQIAAAQPSRVTALRVVNVRPKSGNILDDLSGHLGFEPAVVPEDVARERDNEAAAMVSDWVQRARERGIEAHGSVEVGGVAQTVKKYAADADLVVMGLRGETEERFPKQGGEMAGWITQQVNISVLFGTPEANAITNVAVGYDGSEGARHAVREVRRFLAPLGIPIHAVYVSKDGSGDEALSEVDEQLPDSTVHHHVVRGESVEEALIDKAIELNAEVLVLGFQGRNAVKDFLFGTCTERVLLSGQLAVMVTH
ncbi:MAG: universal stress protein [Myxococcota bacterium]